MKNHWKGCLRWSKLQNFLHLPPWWPPGSLGIYQLTTQNLKWPPKSGIIWYRWPPGFKMLFPALLSSIVQVKLATPDYHPIFEPPKEVLNKAKKATWEYDKRHSSKFWMKGMCSNWKVCVKYLGPSCTLESIVFIGPIRYSILKLLFCCLIYLLFKCLLILATPWINARSEK